MNQNYQIAAGRYLVQDGAAYDIHNNFEFIELSYSVEERSLILKFRRRKRDLIKPGFPKAINIGFGEVSEFRFMPRGSEIPLTEDRCVEMIGYWVDEDWVEGVFFSMEPDSEIEPHWLTAISFMSGAVLAVQAERSRAKFIY